MPRTLKLFLVVITLVCLVIAGSLAFVLQDPERFRSQLAQTLTEVTGAPVSLQGPLHWGLWPSPVLKAGDIVVRAPSLHVHIASVSAQVSMPALLRRELRLRHLLVEDVEVRAGASSGAATEPAAQVALTDPSHWPIDRLQIDRLRIVGQDASVQAIARILIETPTPGELTVLDVRVDDGLSARAGVRVEGTELHLEGVQARSRAGELKGRLTLSSATQPLALSGRLHASRLVLPVSTRDADTRSMIPRVALSPAPLAAMDLQLGMSVDSLVVGDLELRQVDAPLRIEQGVLQLDARALLEGGALELAVTVNAGEQHWVVRLGLADADAGALMRHFGVAGGRPGGTVGLEARLDADGAHSTALIDSLRGKLTLRVADLVVDSNAGEWMVGDLLAGMLKTLRGANQEQLVVHCAVGDFEVRNGVLYARDSIGAQTASANLLGGGTIALSPERLDLLIRPWPREGLGLSATALSGAVSLRGPWRAPQLALTEEAVLRSGIGVGAAVLTGGLSLIAQGLLERARGDTPCEQALGMLKVERGSEAVAGSLDAQSREVARSLGDGATSVGKAVGRGVSEATSTLKEGVQSLGRGLKGLFGGGGAAAPPPREPQ